MQASTRSGNDPRFAPGVDFAMQGMSRAPGLSPRRQLVEHRQRRNWDGEQGAAPVCARHRRRACEGGGLTVSDLIRILLQLPAEHIIESEPRAVLVVNATSAAQLVRQAWLWSYQHNQIVHALNRIAYYMGRDVADGDDVMEQFQIVEEKVDRANADIAALKAQAQRMAAMFSVKK